ncbi:lactate dehydrogenase [Edaphobacter acidisoli]|uniref:Lactate dehydrogenase n=1 Tax=Edaphobacter acidisoli TaxID=2040573 RepID=A0A916RE10_9BACT|nr:Ldh family oxidoreductase [Edaphobacter acidisoli]GGA53575.1 lactate dehydrogenase [Edaphobacter acidisoli]
MKKFQPQQMRSLAARLATAVGVPSGDAEILADALVDADLQGTSTHGISRLNIYLQRMTKGLIAPKATLSIERDSGSVLALDAGNGLGQVQAVKALGLLLPLARANGVAAATIRNSQHFGALSYYCNRAANEGMVLLAMTNCEPAMSPEGGYQAFFGTNPIAASFPTGKGFHIKIDLATSIIARGNIIAAQKKKQAIPEGWALDRHGNPTTDAQEALLGTVLTMAGHKGYALALMVEIFSSVLSGAAIGADIGSMYKNMDRKQDVGHFFCLLNIAAFLDPDEFCSRIDDMIDRIKASAKRPGVDEILVPGERSARNALVNEIQGISVSQETLAELQQWCSRLNVPLDCIEVNA